MLVVTGNCKPTTSSPNSGCEEAQRTLNATSGQMPEAYISASAVIRQSDSEQANFRVARDPPICFLTTFRTWLL
jgi:hypothetical protein